MPEPTSWRAELAAALPRHAAVIDGLAGFVESEERCRWLEVGCSLGARRGDELSDIDAAIGYDGALDPDALVELGRVAAAAGGALVDAQAHRMDGWSEDLVRIAGEYDSGVQLDLCLFPATLRTGLFDGVVAVVDKDGRLAVPAQSRLFGSPDGSVAREWTMLGWWAVSDIAKYVARGSWFEAVARIDTVRHLALRLDAAARAIPYPSFGLTSLLDFPPFELPALLADTYCRPDRPDDVAAAALAVTDLLADAADRAARELSIDLGTPWSVTCRARLDESLASLHG
jgi:hypothetical protein